MGKRQNLKLRRILTANQANDAKLFHDDGRTLGASASWSAAVPGRSFTAAKATPKRQRAAALQNLAELSRRITKPGHRV